MSLRSFVENQSLTPLVGDEIHTGVACACHATCPGEYLTRRGAHRQLDQYGRKTQYAWCSEDCGSMTFLVGEWD